MQKLIFSLLLLIHFSSNAQTFSGTGGPISDDGLPNDYTISVSALSPATLDTTHGLIGVCLNITHTWDSDLNIVLIAPDGTSFTVLSGVGGDGDNFTNTCFAHTATNGISSGAPPFTGTFKPQERMGNVNNGQNGNGIWKLRIIDTYPADPGNLLSWNITFGPNAEAPFTFDSSNVPLVVIDTYGSTIVNEPKITANIKIIDNGYGNYNRLTDAPVFQGDMGIEIRGAYSASLPQKPYTLELRDSLGNNVDTALLGMPREHDWHLLATYNDKAFSRNTLANHLFTEMNHYATRAKYCEVFINGNYQGIYFLSETMKRDNNRIDLARLDTADNTGLNVTGGYIIKNDYWDGSNSWLNGFSPIDHPGMQVHTVYHYPKPDVITTPQKNYIQSFVNQFETALYSSTFTDTLNGYRKYADVFSFVDYLIVNELARNTDGFKKSFYFHKDKDNASEISKLVCGPVWDFDWAWKNIWDCSIFSATDGSGWSHHINDCSPDVNSNGWHVRMMQDTNFQNILRCRWERFRSSILDTTYLFNYIDSVANYLDMAQVRHYEKWGHLGINSGAPEVGTIPTTFAGEISNLKNWIKLRVDWLDSNIPGNTYNCNFLGLSSVENTAYALIFPNPANNEVYLAPNGFNGTLSIQIRSIDGKLINTYQGNAAQTGILSVQDMQAGVYLVQVNDDYGHRFQTRLIVAH